jgi:hypothetical protein
MIEAARPLYAVGGYRLALLLPMFGGVACALGARHLASRLAPGSGDAAFWLVGLASPIAIYSLDLWEHVLGVAAVLWAVVLLTAPGARRRWLDGVGAGALFGLAATMRTEALVYCVVAVAIGCGWELSRRRGLGPPLALGASAGAGFAVVWAANVALERSLSGISRSARASGAASAATGTDAASQWADRLQEGLVTSLGLKGATAASWLMGLGLLAVLGFAWRMEQRGDRRLAVGCLGLVGVVYLVAAGSDVGFVPGMIPAFPVIAGLAIGRWTDQSRLVVAIALSALPVVWAFQYLGAAGPQWGGRYTLPSSVLLGTVAIASLRDRRDVLKGLGALCACVTIIGLVWVAARTRSVDDLFTDLRAVDADVLIVRDAFLLRESGPVLLDEHWLTAAGEDQFAFATEVAADSGAQTVAVVELGAPAPPDSAIPDRWIEVSRQTVDLAGDPMGLVVYRLP